MISLSGFELLCGVCVSGRKDVWEAAGAGTDHCQQGPVVGLLIPGITPGKRQTCLGVW